ncbi:MAG: hypothetical protein HOL37_06010 [Rhodospirillaceae bacterium]|nr:hypothetical protein [Rhodospirillaceae bacterium]MBT4219995.1 hypothetical protein [Rhodospirillaceae bacterium]MBT4463658.1 hypothetical protein [Rhodospirillaceae bacterium]MBT5308869.1 hypothetical protein [Rhodospirillaceae bacterium]MBT7355926.1 hypothetical protein [Rhodospirillaceae bacterium]
MKSELPKEKFSGLGLDDQGGRAGETSQSSDPHELMGALQKAMCRQHIMWPADGPLACEEGRPCDSQDKCTELANSVLDYRHVLKSKK